MNSWQSPVAAEPSVGTYHPFEYSTSTSDHYALWQPTATGQRKTYDFSTIIPVGAKAAEISVFGYIKNSTGSAVDGEMRIHFINDNTLTPDYRMNTLRLSVGGRIGPTPNFGSGSTAGKAPLDSGRLFYGYCETFSGAITGMDVYLVILGYYL